MFKIHCVVKARERNVHPGRITDFSAEMESDRFFAGIEVIANHTYPTSAGLQQRSLRGPGTHNLNFLYLKLSGPFVETSCVF